MTERNDEYRDETRKAIKDVNWTLWKVLPTLIIVLLVLTVVGWGLQSAGIIGKDIDREVVRHSRQFTESKQASLQNLLTQHATLETKIAEAEAVGATKVVNAAKAQQKALVAQMRREAGNIPASEVPKGINRLINE